MKGEASANKWDKSNTMDSTKSRKALTRLDKHLNRTSSSKSVKFFDETRAKKVEKLDLRRNPVQPRTIVLDIEEQDDVKRSRKGILRSSLTRSAPTISTTYQLEDITHLKGKIFFN